MGEGLVSYRPEEIVPLPFLNSSVYRLMVINYSNRVSF